MSSFGVTRSTNTVRGLDERLSHAVNQLVESSFFLARQESQGDEGAKLSAIQRTLRGIHPGSLFSDPVSPENIRVLARAVLTDARRANSKDALSGGLERVAHALRISRGEILVPELPHHQRVDLLDATALRYRVTIGARDYLEKSVLMSFVIPAGVTSLSIGQDLIIACKGVQRKRQAVEQESLRWLERHGAEPMGQRDLLVTVGKRIPIATNQPFERQKKIANEAGFSLPSRELGTIMHSLGYLLTGRSIFEGFSAKLDDGNALNFSRRGLCLEFGQKVAMFSEVFPVRIDQI